jgi:hypothetical protein
MTYFWSDRDSNQRLLNTSADRHRHDNLLGDQMVTRGYIQVR